MPSIRERWHAMIRPNVWVVDFGGDAPTQVKGFTAKKLYATQPNIYAVVNFLASSIAQLPLNVYVRDGETERRRDRDSAAALLLRHPNADQTTYEFVRAVAVEYLLVGRVYVWVLPDADSPSGWQMRVIPNEWIIDKKSDSAYASKSITVQSRSSDSAVDIPREEFVCFSTYSPGNPGGFISPLAPLRVTLTEQVEADRFRTKIWKSSGRFNAYISRPANVQPWDNQQRQRFVAAFREAWMGGGSNEGKMPLLEDGMEIKPYTFNAREAQWMEAKQLSREDSAAIYGLNPSLVWHTGTQTYASAKDNARALYADCLGTHLQMLQQRINSFLFPMVGADPRTYAEFDLQEKLKGSFEERAQIMQSSVGGPWLTRNEARAMNNLPPIDGGDALIVPLNVVEGGQASPTDTHMQTYSAPQPETKAAPESEPEQIEIKGASDEEEDAELAEAFSKFFKRQRASVLPKLGAKSAEWWDEERWNAELADDIEPVIDGIADKHGIATAKELGNYYGTEVTRKYLRKLAEGRARSVNAATYADLLVSLEDEELEPAAVFEERETSGSEKLGRSIATSVAGWAVLECCRQAKRDGNARKMTKRWVTGSNPRPSHAAMDGETVAFDVPFSNGADYPGDASVLSDDELANCNCSCIVTAQ